MSERLDGCAEFDARLLEGAFAPSPDARLDTHLAGCARCRSARDRYLATADALAGALASEEGAAPAAPRFVYGRTVRRAWLLAGAASLAAAAAVLSWLALRDPDVSVITLQGAVASFEDAEHVRLEAGTARFEVRRGSLEVATPLGTVRCASGAFTVEVRQGKEESDMKHSGAAVVSVAVAVTAGVAWWMSGDEEVAVPAGASIVQTEPEPEMQRPTETTPVVPEPVDALEGSSRVSATAPPAPPAKDASPLPDVHMLGRVIDAETRAPVPGAEVLMVTREGPRRTMAFRATSDAEGRFTGRMEEASPVSIDRRLGDGSRARLLVLAEGYAALRSTPEDILRGTSRPPKQVEGGFEWDLGDIPLTRGTLVRGRVVWAETGEPIGGARLLFLPADERNRLWVLHPSLAHPLGRTLPDGSFAERLAPTLAQDNPVLYALSERGLGWTDMVLLEGRSEVQFEIAIQPPLQLEVAVRSENGHPIAGALVRAVPRFRPLVNAYGPPAEGLDIGLGLDMQLVELFSQTSDEQGVARFGSLPPPPAAKDGTQPDALFEITALARGFQRTSKALRSQDGARVELTMPALTLRSVSGAVIASDGDPIEGAKVSISGGGTALELRTDSRGRFWGSDLDTSWPELHFVVEAPGFAKQIARHRLRPDNDLGGVNFVLRREVPIAGRVIDGSGRPVAGARVSISRDGVHYAFRPEGEGTGPDGRFGFTEADEGEWQVEFWAPEPHEAWEEVRLRDTAHGGDRSLELVLRRADPLESARLVAEVVDGLGGQALDPAEVMVLPRQETGAPPRHVPTVRESGRVIAERLPVGAWRVWVKVRGRPMAFADVDVARGQSEVHARIEVGEPGAIAGRVRFDSDLPFRPCRIYGSLGRAPGGSSWWDGGASFAEVEVQPDGSFLLEGLAPGRWTLSLSGEGLLGELEVRVRSAVTESIDLQAVQAARLAFHGTAPRSGVIRFSALGPGASQSTSLRNCRVREGEPFRHVQDVLPGSLRWRAEFVEEGPSVTAARWAEAQEGEVEAQAGETIEVEVPVMLLPEDG